MIMTNQEIKDHIINKAVENLQEFGYSSVNKENIFTDMVYSMFFKNMLKDSRDESEGYPRILRQLMNYWRK